MKSLIFIAALFSVSHAFATVDVQSQITIVTMDFHAEDGNEYETQKVPAEFCVGDPAEALAKGISKPVIIKTNYGCGHGNDMVADSQINQATCAVIIVKRPNQEKYDNLEVTINTAACGEKSNNTSFQEALKAATTKTFNDGGFQIVDLKVLTKKFAQ